MKFFLNVTKKFIKFFSWASNFLGHNRATIFLGLKNFFGIMFGFFGIMLFDNFAPDNDALIITLTDLDRAVCIV